MDLEIWNTRLARTALALSVALGFALGTLHADTTDDSASLYQRLGGKPAVAAVVDDFVTRIVADDQVNHWFHHAASSPELLAAYKSKVADFVCQAASGPCKYVGLDMLTAHRGRGVTTEAFDRVVSHLVATLEKLNVPPREKNELLGLLAPLKKVIAEKKAAD